MADGDGFTPRTGRIGARWYNASPTPEELVEWFATVPLHPGLEHANYVAGISLIQTTDKTKQIVGERGDGTVMTTDVEDVCFTPYPRVETRIAYFWDYVRTLGVGYKGAIEPELIAGEPNGLPEGFFKLKVERDAAVTPFIGRSMRVRIMDPRGEDLHFFPSEAKTVPLLLPWAGGVDEHAFAKASTGAIGRALGVAGMLVLPGTGIATAEDMQELHTRATPGAEDALAIVAAARAPAPEDNETNRNRLRSLMIEIQASDQREPFLDWWNQRHLPGLEALDAEQMQVALARAKQLHERATPVEASLAPSLPQEPEPIEPVKES